jgi:hypothetical protein
MLLKISLGLGDHDEDCRRVRSTSRTGAMVRIFVTEEAFEAIRASGARLHPLSRRCGQIWTQCSPALGSHRARRHGGTSDSGH